LTTHFGRSEAQAELAAKERAESGKQLQDEANHSIPGYEMFLYDRLIPLAFELPNRQGFNLKDAQTLQVSVLNYTMMLLIFYFPKLRYLGRLAHCWQQLEKRGVRKRSISSRKSSSHRKIGRLKQFRALLSSLRGRTLKVSRSIGRTSFVAHYLPLKQGNMTQPACTSCDQYTLQSIAVLLTTVDPFLRVHH
jgi:hypothetical protein